MSEDDEVTREYLRASTREAGRPSDIARAAIMAQARRAAAERRRAPVMRTWWRAAASVGVLGVAVLAWRELGGPNVTPTSFDAIEVTAARVESAPPAPTSPPATEPAPALAPAPAPMQPVARERVARDASAADSVAAATPPTEAELRTAPQAKAAAANESRASMQAVPAVPASREFSQALRAAPPPGDGQLVQSQFAAEYASASPPALLWLLQDAAGTVLRKGTLPADGDLPRVTADLQRDYPEQVVSTWNLRTLVNAQGRTLTLVTARATPRNP